MKTAKHNKIIDYIDRVPEDRVFLILKNIHYSFGEIKSLCTQFKEEYPDLIDRNCAVISQDRESLAIYLAAIDSVSKITFLQPNDIKDNEIDFYEAIHIDYVIRLANGKITSVEQSVCTPEREDINQYSESYVLATSGTTGTPKLASYSLDSLAATAKKDIGKGTDFVWGLCYDINRFAGLQVYLQTIVSGSTMVISSQNEPINSLVDLYSKSAVNCLSATPSFWRKILMDPTHRNIPLKRITLGGEISNQNILSALGKSYPNASIIHIYASTEAGVGFVVKDQKEGFPTDYVKNNSLVGCNLKVENDLLWIKSSHGCSRFVNGNLDYDKDGFINTGDLVRIDGERVYFLGRDSGSINVGGNKVMPEKIEAILELCSCISMAIVFSKKNSVLGALVAAEVVLSKSDKHRTSKEVKKEIISFCRNKLELFEVPAIIEVVDNIQINSTGKKNRNI